MEIEGPNVQSLAVPGESENGRWLFSGKELARLIGFYSFIILLHILGWGFFLHYSQSFGAVYAGAGLLAYGFGLRHAFDADHISAIDDTTRLLIQQGRR